MGAKQSYIKKVNFEDIQYLISKDRKDFVLMNTLDKEHQSCLIHGTICIRDEESVINKCLKKAKNINIIIYDKNAHQKKLLEKYEQLLGLGFMNVYMYPGGLFEWLLLQDIYGYEEFPTTSKDLDILKYKAQPMFKNKLLLGDID
jgi:hypothetical protein